MGMSERKNALRSALEDDPAMIEEICDFIVGLAEYVDGLQDAEFEGDLPRVLEMCATLAIDATRLGYTPLADIAKRAADACRDHKAQEAQDCLIELTEISQRVRRGHRGAT